LRKGKVVESRDGMTMEVGRQEVVFRRYRDGDLTAICWLDEACFAAEFRFDQGAMRRFVGRRGAIVVVAEALEGGDATEGGEVAGFCIVHTDGRGGAVRGYVVTLDVAEEWRRRGLASKLMEEVEGQAQAVGAVAMDLHVWTGNEGAIRFYEGRGYGRMGLVKRFYGASGLDAFVYRKVLAGPG
jgi:[ribosomal protein S18]-alanine N-acetyltransferase